MCGTWTCAIYLHNIYIISTHIYTYLHISTQYLLTAVYLLCWSPHWATQLLLVFAPPGSVSQQSLVTAALASTCLQYSNSAINPVLYTFLSDHFRRSFLDTCWCRGAGPSRHHRDLTFTTRRTRRGPVYTAVMQVNIPSQLLYFNLVYLNLFSQFGLLLVE